MHALLTDSGVLSLSIDFLAAVQYPDPPKCGAVIAAEFLKLAAAKKSANRPCNTDVQAGWVAVVLICFFSAGRVRVYLSWVGRQQQTGNTVSWKTASCLFHTRQLWTRPTVSKSELNIYSRTNLKPPQHAHICELIFCVLPKKFG